MNDVSTAVKPESASSVLMVLKVLQEKIHLTLRNLLLQEKVPLKAEE